jgi:hypothetical protein
VTSRVILHLVETAGCASARDAGLMALALDGPDSARDAGLMALATRA